MSDALVKPAPRALDPVRDPQVELDDRLQRRLRKDVALVALSDHIFEADNSPSFTSLTKKQQAIARAWELPRRQIPFALESAAQRLAGRIKGNAAARRTTFNVENMTVQLPEKAAPLAPPVYVDVETK